MQIIANICKYHIGDGGCNMLMDAYKYLGDYGCVWLSFFGDMLRPKPQISHAWILSVTDLDLNHRLPRSVNIMSTSTQQIRSPGLRKLQQSK